MGGTQEIALQKALALIQGHLGLGAPGQLPDVTCEGAWLHWLRHHRCGPRTVDGYKSMYANHIGPTFGLRDLSTITAQDIADFRASLRETHTPATRNRIVGVLRTLLKHATRYNLITRNPIPDCDKEAENNVREVVVSEATIQRVLEYLEHEYLIRRGDHAWMIGAYFLVCVESGLRRNEACAVRWDQCNPTAGTLEVSWRDSKGSQARTTLLQDRTWSWIQRLPRLGDHVFHNPETLQPYRPNHWEVCWQTIRKRLELDHVTLHDLRRTFVTMGRRRGIAETVLMRLSGHRSHEVFKRYAIVGPEDFIGARASFERGRLRDAAELAAEKRKRKPKKSPTL